MSSPYPPYPQQYSYPPQPAPRKPYNILSIIALATTIICPFVSVVLAIIAIYQINERQQRGKPLAVAALVVSILWILSALVIITLTFKLLMGDFCECNTVVSATANTHTRA